jgi:hypothetical protein
MSVSILSKASERSAWKKAGGCICLAGLLLSIGNWSVQFAQAQDTGVELQTSSPNDALAFGTYFWMTNYAGSMTIDGQTVDMTGVNVFDLLGNGDLNFPPLVALVDWNHGNWGAYFDGTLIGINFGSGDVSLGAGPLTASFGMDFTWGLVNAGGKYTVANWETVTYSNKLDLLAGVRYTYYDVDLNGSIGATPVSMNETLHWVDGTIGARFIGQHSNGLSYSALADLGLGAGVSAQALGTVGYTWKKQSFDLNAFVGYRAMYQDWSRGNDAVDLTSHGPLLGLKLVF